MIARRDINHFTALNVILERVSSEFGIKICWGIEVEFYLLYKNSGLPIEDQELVKGLQTIPIIAERGKGQYEFHSNIHHEVSVLFSEINSMLLEIREWAEKSSWQAVFAPKPFADDYGSAMQINFSLLDNNTGQNLLSKGVKENLIAGNVIGGILSTIASTCYLVLRGDANEFQRLQPKWMAPVNISWGFNNRTTLLRLPDVTPDSRRIEFRLPSARCLVMESLLVLAAGILYGLREMPEIPEPIYGNAHDYPQCRKLPESEKEAEELYLLHDLLNKLLYINNNK